MKLVLRLRRGIEAGGLAGAGVALFYTAMDVVRLAPLDTVAGLARAFFGMPVDTTVTGFDAAAMVTTGAGVLLYSALHFLAFGVLGIVATWVVPGATFWRTLARGGAFGAVGCSAVFYGGRALSGSPFVVESVGTTSLLLVNAMAGVIMAVVFAVHTADDAAAHVSV